MVRKSPQAPRKVSLNAPAPASTSKVSANSVSSATQHSSSAVQSSEAFKLLLVDHYTACQKWKVLTRKIVSIVVKSSITLPADSSKVRLNDYSSSNRFRISQSDLNGDFSRQNELELVENIQSIRNQHGLLKVIEEKIYKFLLDSSRQNSISYAFEEPLWLTWTMARFSDAIATVNSSHTASMHLLDEIASILTCEVPCTTEEYQALVTYLAVQPFMSSHGMDSVDWLDEICEVEIPDWRERARNK